VRHILGAMPFPAEPGNAEVGARMGKAWRELRRGPSTLVVIEELFGPPGGRDSVEPVHLDVLDLLTTRGDLRMSDLATELRVDPSTVTRTLQRMEAAGLARRVPDGGDGRVVKVQLTAEGVRLHGIVAARRAAILDAIFKGFDPDDRAQLVDLLELFIESVEEYAASRLAEQRAASSG
jgi:DNA-binding MarR family transcriptional regulator